MDPTWSGAGARGWESVSRTRSVWPRVVAPERRAAAPPRRPARTLVCWRKLASSTTCLYTAASPKSASFALSSCREDISASGHGEDAVAVAVAERERDLQSTAALSSRAAALGDAVEELAALRRWARWVGGGRRAGGGRRRGQGGRGRRSGERGSWRGGMG